MANYKKKGTKKGELEKLEAWFKDHPYVKQIMIGYKGTFCINECRGETYEQYFGEEIIDEMLPSYKGHKCANLKYVDEKHPEYSEEKFKVALDKLKTEHSPSVDVDVYMGYRKRGFDAAIITRKNAKGNLRMYKITVDVE